MGRHFKSVSDMVRQLSSDESFKREALAGLQDKELAMHLFVLRCKEGLSQKQLAQKMGATQSRVSKIESAPNREMTVKDLLDYAKALDLQLEIGYRKPIKSRTKSSVDSIHIVSMQSILAIKETSHGMRVHYDFSKMKGKKSPYAKALR